MNQLENFTSLPPNEERTFLVYEQNMRDKSKKAGTIGVIAGGLVGLIAIIIVATVTPEKKEMISAEDMQGLTKTKKEEKKETPAPTPPPSTETPAPGATAPGTTAPGATAPGATPEQGATTPAGGAAATPAPAEAPATTPAPK